MSTQLQLKQNNSISRISGLVLINAFIFQEILSQHNERVSPLHKTVSHDNFLMEFCEHWDFIVKEINYFPIFNIARNILLDLPSERSVLVEALRELASTAQKIVGNRAALRHDLMGRVYHRLLADAKYLGTYYTSIPAATLLLKLALDPSTWKFAWHEIEGIKRLRVADLACGTGTLLMASADAIVDNYIGASSERGDEIKVGDLQNALIEEVVHGYDVLPSAIHLTASTLSLRAPNIAFTKTNLFSLPLGGEDCRLGSIDFIKQRMIEITSDLFSSSSQQIKGKGVHEILSTVLPSLDLCVMNPPFTRSVGGNLLFGSVPEPEREKMKKELSRLVKKPDISANITAGLGSVFIATAHPYIKPGARLALVLPKAFLSGVAWGKTRKLISKNYIVDYLIVSQDPLHWNFSESTNLSEVMIVATKKQNGNEVTTSRLTALNLWRNPTTNFESLAISKALTKGNSPDLENGQGSLEIMIGKNKFGESISYDWNKLKNKTSWMLPCAFGQSDLLRVSSFLLEGKVWLPGFGQVGNVPLCLLSSLGDLGPDARDIHDCFKLSQSATSYPAFWGHDSKLVYRIAQEPNNYLIPLPESKKGRHLRKVEDIWPFAGSLLIAERIRVNTHRLIAVNINEKTLSSMWWSFSFKNEIHNHSELSKIQSVWLNSTLGFTLFLLHRVETAGAWVKFKKPILLSMPVLDQSKLSASSIKELISVYDRFSKEPLLPFSEINSDKIRAQIDIEISRVLNLPDLHVLRMLLAREPIVCLRRV